MAASLAPEATVPLTDYEKRQVQAIAAWKGEKPGVTKRVANAVAGPLGKLANRIIPDKPVQAAMDAVNKAAAQIARDDSILKDDILKAAGVETLDGLAEKPLDFADSLADRIIADAANIALGMGAATGAGGPVSTAVGIPALLFGALRVIHRIAQCYGFTLKSEADREFMIGVLSLSTATSPEHRAKAMDNYRRQIETSFLNQAVEESANKALQRAILGAELGALIPGFSIAFNAWLSREFVSRAGVTAKRVFQERWLRDRGKVGWITPA
jgi:hypothetical protein